MSRLFKNFIMISVFSLMVAPLFAAGDRIDEASIEFSMNIDGEDIDPMAAAMLKNAKLIMSFKEHYFKAETDMSMMTNTVISNSKTNKGIMFMAVMGQKIAVPMDSEELKKYNDKSEDDVKVEFPGQTKTIAGYDCKKAVVTIKDGPSTVIYYTEKIAPVNSNSKYSYKEIDGFPLQIETEQNGMNIVMKAEKVSTKVTTDFDMTVPEGYSEMTFEQMSGMFGGQ